MHIIRRRWAQKGAPVSNPNCIRIRNPGFAPRVSRQLTFELIRHLNPRLDSGLGAGLTSRVKPLLISQLDADFVPHLKTRFKSLFGPSLTSRLALRFNSRIAPCFGPRFTPKVTPGVTPRFRARIH